MAAVWRPSNRSTRGWQARFGSGPKTSYFYDADHSLASPEKVRADRIAWLKTQIAR
jgi:hypothetical protein